MIAGHGVLLLVAGFVFLIDDDEAKMLEGQEDRRTHAENNLVGVGRQLLLPYFHSLRITVLGVVDAQTVAEDTAQAVHHLHRQRYLGQQVEHLLMAVDGLLNKMNVNFGLAAARHTVEQHHPVLKPLHPDAVQSVRLRFAEWLNGLGVRLASVVEPPHLTLCRSEQATFQQGVICSRRGMAGVQKLVARHLAAVSRHRQKSLKRL